MTFGSFCAKFHEGSLSPLWHVVHTFSVTWCGVAENASCWVPMPWQFSHCTLAIAGVSVPLRKPPGWLNPATWHVMHSLAVSLCTSVRVFQACACLVAFHCSPCSVWQRMQTSAPTNLSGFFSTSLTAFCLAFSFSYLRCCSLN